MKAILRFYRQSPRKVRLLADRLRGMPVLKAATELSFHEKKAARPLKKLLLSAAANARENDGAEIGDLYVKELRVDEGVILKRYRPVWRGMAHPINRRTSHVTVLLGRRKDTEAAPETGKTRTENSREKIHES